MDDETLKKIYAFTPEQQEAVQVAMLELARYAKKREGDAGKSGCLCGHAAHFFLREYIRLLWGVDLDGKTPAFPVGLRHSIQEDLDKLAEEDTKDSP